MRCSYLSHVNLHNYSIVERNRVVIPESRLMISHLLMSEMYNAINRIKHDTPNVFLKLADGAVAVDFLGKLKNHNCDVMIYFDRLDESIYIVSNSKDVSCMLNYSPTKLSCSEILTHLQSPSKYFFSNIELYLLANMFMKLGNSANV